MIEEIQQTNHNYQMLSIKDNWQISYDSLAKKFNYTPKFIKKGEYFKIIGWNISSVTNLINDIISNSNYKLISVSEDNDYIRYHFVS